MEVLAGKTQHPGHGADAQRLERLIFTSHGRSFQRLFDLYAYGNHTLDTLIEHLAREGIAYTDATYRFPRSKLHAILRDRAYLGEVHFRGQWHPGSHEPLVDRRTFERVQHLLGEQVYRAHEMLFASELIHCAHCGHPITGERKTKSTKRGTATYVYYRCARYNRKDQSPSPWP